MGGPIGGPICSLVSAGRGRKPIGYSRVPSTFISDIPAIIQKAKKQAGINKIGNTWSWLILRGWTMCRIEPAIRLVRCNSWQSITSRFLHPYMDAHSSWSRWATGNQQEDYRGPEGSNCPAHGTRTKEYRIRISIIKKFLKIKAINRLIIQLKITLKINLELQNTY